MTRKETYLNKVKFLVPYICMAETSYKTKELTFEQCVNKLRNIAYDNGRRIGRTTIERLLKEEISMMKNLAKKWEVNYRE